jgi:hypothetical protein
MPKFPDVNVELVGQDGNAFSIIGRVRGALRDAGHSDAASEFQAEAMSGDYDHLLRTVMDYVNVDDDDGYDAWDEDGDYDY